MNLSRASRLLLPGFAGLGLLLVDPAPAAASPFWAQVPGVNVTAQNLDWETLSSTMYTQPAVAASAVSQGGMMVNHVHVFYRDGNKCLQHLEGTDRGQDFTPVAVPGPCDTDFDGPVTAVAWDNSGRFDLFWFSGFAIAGQPHPTLMHRWTDGSQWASERLAVTSTVPASAPTVASWGTGHLDVFWRDTGNQVRWLGFERDQKGKPGYTPGGWFDAERVVASNVTGDPTAVERATSIIDLFWRDSGGHLDHEYSGTAGASWSGIVPLGVPASTAPSATSWGTSRLDVVYGVDTTHLGHLWIDGGTGSWAPKNETLVSSQVVGVPVGVAAPSHAGRLDVFGSPSGTRLAHTLYQESLPGFVGVGEGSNGANGDWCWASAAVSVVNYATYDATHVNPGYVSCEAANKELGMTTCCETPTAPAACRVGGTVQPVLNAYGVSYQDDPVPSLAEMRSKLWGSHQAFISHHQHPGGDGHFVDLVDTYRLHGEDMVVVFGTQFNANWVDTYTDYVAKHPSWWVADVFTNFVKH